MNTETKRLLEYKKLMSNERLLIEGCEFKIVKVGSYEYLVRGQKHLRLANDPVGDFRIKTLIAVYRCYQKQKPELVGYFKQDKSFVSIRTPNYRKERAVFYGDSGIAIANQLLRSTGRYELADGINQMLCQTVTMLDD